MRAAMRASAAAAGRINQAGRVRPRQHGWLACGSGSGGLAYGSAWVGLACARMLPSIHLDNTSIEQHAKLIGLHAKLIGCPV